MTVYAPSYNTMQSNTIDRYPVLFHKTLRNIEMQGIAKFRREEHRGCLELPKSFTAH